MYFLHLPNTPFRGFKIMIHLFRNYINFENHKTMETSVEQISRRQKMKKYAFGALVVLAGALLLAFNFDLLPHEWRRVIFSWEMLLIAIGLISLFGNENKLPGLILIAIGGFFLIPDLFIMHISFYRLFWPLILIIIGILILSRKRIDGRWRHRFEHVNTNLTGEGYINETNIFSGSKQKVTNQVFKGGRISNIFGGTEIDLTQATLPEGQTELTIECIFGGVTLIVPADWKVVLNISAIMGGFSDKRLVIKETTDPNKILVIRGEAIFGGGDIKSY
jgi:predicted membrane protein